MELPKDFVMLLSFVNMQLRDHYGSLDDLCKSLDIQKDDLIDRLSMIDYEYDATVNQFR